MLEEEVSLRNMSSGDALPLFSLRTFTCLQHQVRNAGARKHAEEVGRIFVREEVLYDRLADKEINPKRLDHGVAQLLLECEQQIKTKLYGRGGEG